MFAAGTVERFAVSGEKENIDSVLGKRAPGTLEYLEFEALNICVQEMQPVKVMRRAE